MTIRDRLKWLLDEKVLVELYFAPSHNSYRFLARITRVGQDYVEFDAYDEEENVIAHNLMPLHLLAGVTITSSDRNREQLERLLQQDEHPRSSPPAGG